MTTIGNSAFASDAKLSVLNIFGTDAVNGKLDLTNITTLGENAFTGCSAATTAEFGTGCTNVSENGFFTGHNTNFTV